SREMTIPRILVLSGTGSICCGQSPSGKTAKVGGWGHFLGDQGSAYDIGLLALRAVVYRWDCDGVWSSLGQQLLHALQLNEPADLIEWTIQATKADVAALAVEVFSAWGQGDRMAADIIKGAARSLAHDAVACARRLAKPGAAVLFVLAGGVLLKEPRMAKLVRRLLRKLWPGAAVRALNREGAWGAVELARRHYGGRHMHRAGTGVHWPEEFTPTLTAAA